MRPMAGGGGTSRARDTAASADLHPSVCTAPSRWHRRAASALAAAQGARTVCEGAGREGGSAASSVRSAGEPWGVGRGRGAGPRARRSCVCDVIDGGPGGGPPPLTHTPSTTSPAAGFAAAAFLSGPSRSRRSAPRVRHTSRAGRGASGAGGGEGSRRAARGRLWPRDRGVERGKGRGGGCAGSQGKSSGPWRTARRGVGRRRIFLLLPPPRLFFLPPRTRAQRWCIGAASVGSLAAHWCATRACTAARKRHGVVLVVD